MDEFFESREENTAPGTGRSFEKAGGRALWNSVVVILEIFEDAGPKFAVGIGKP
jgi:hypothetical protein